MKGQNSARSQGTQKSFRSSRRGLIPPARHPQDWKAIRSKSRLFSQGK